jgi:hypothetical protein
LGLNKKLKDKAILEELEAGLVLSVENQINKIFKLFKLQILRKNHLVSKVDIKEKTINKT